MVPIQIRAIAFHSCQPMSEPIRCDNLDLAIEQYKRLGYRLDMIFPADDPREAVVSRGGATVLLQKPARSKGTLADHGSPYYVRASATEWTPGRAGMMYRDLLADRMGGRVAVSQIRITKGGEVPDYVHYHKVEFQVIYCLRGRIKVVYEDQGPPFWLEPGDLVLQPPEIRHRVLECEANSEVIEVSMPGEHETWLDHELNLPTGELKPDRVFGTQPFVRLEGSKTSRPEAHFGPALASLSEILVKNQCITPAIQCIIPMIQTLPPSDLRQESS